MWINRSYTLLLIGGLGVGLCAALCLALWVQHHLSYDRMHSKADRIYIVNASMDAQRQEIWYYTPAPLLDFAKQKVPGVEEVVRIKEGESFVVAYEGKKFQEEGAYVDASYFDLFDFKLIKGSQTHPFSSTHSIVINREIADKLFVDQDPIGKTIQLNEIPYTVSAVIENMPENSSLQQAMLLPFDQLLQSDPDRSRDWGNFAYKSFVYLSPEANPQEVQKQLQDIHMEQNPEGASFLSKLQYGLQPLLEFHLHGENQRIQQLRLFAIIAFIILGISCINYVNLVTARVSRRYREVGLRKAIGAENKQLFWQFIAEAWLIFIPAVILALLGVYLGLPLYKDLSGVDLSFSLLDPLVWMLIAVACIIMTLIAGVYPALMMANFRVVSGLKGMTSGGKHAFLRRCLVVLQFSCTVLLIIATLVIARQLQYIQGMDLGYNQQQVFYFPAHNLQNHHQALSVHLHTEAGVQGFTGTNFVISNFKNKTNGIDWQGKPENMDNFMINNLMVDPLFLDVMGIELLEGTGFSGTEADAKHFLLNQAAVEAMGLSNPVGRRIEFNEVEGTVVGVFKDFHFQHVRSAIEPLLLYTNALSNTNWSYMYVRVDEGMAQKALDAVQTYWDQYNGDYAFEYHFMDASFEQMYADDIRTGKLFSVCAGLAIFLSCLGLFGLVTYMAESRVKEIGVRKTLGAGILDIVALLSYQLLKLVGLAFLISLPLAWWLMHTWLENYAYRAHLSWWIFALAGGAALLLALLTIGLRSWKAAKENPVNALAAE